MYDFRTDLADERRDLYKKINQMQQEIPGIITDEEVIDEKIKITRVEIQNEQGAEALGKPIGNYITVDIKKLNIITEEEIQKAAESTAKEIKARIDHLVQEKDDILVVGLGNADVTPDALGPKVVKHIEVTRHIIRYLPQYIDEQARPVSAVAPGVLGTTGIETLEIVQGIVENIKPKLLIVIDALASNSMERISSTIQIADTGIVPGAGVGNTRKEISQKTLGIPVIAIGIPTVVETAVVVNEALDLLIEKYQQEAKSNDALNQMKEKDNYEEIKEALIPKDYNFIVTPKEIDQLMINMSKIVSKAMNMAF